MFTKSVATLSESDILKQVSQDALAHYYFGLTRVPCLINSPFRVDRAPSLSFFKTREGDILFIDFANGMKGNIFSAIAKLLDTTYETALIKINQDIQDGALSENRIFHETSKVNHTNFRIRGKTKLAVTVRNWTRDDKQYWNNYGITLAALRYAEVYPVKTIWVYRGENQQDIPADKYAYAYIERKEGDITMKIYQPFNTDGFKWRNNHDKSVIGLWTKLPETGDAVCVCSSLKDALCLWCNAKIPSVYIQGEGFPISKHAQNDLKKRFTNVYICLDNDKAGLAYGEKLAEQTGFKNIVLPAFDWGKDISDFYKGLKNKKDFTLIIKKLFSNEKD